MILTSSIRASQTAFWQGPAWLVCLPLLGLAGCGTATSSSAPEGKATVLLSVTSDAKQSPQSVDMAMKLAGFSLDEGRKVVMFFNVKGVKMPVNEFPADSAFGENEPLKKQLTDLIERGADIHVCPICMKALGVKKEDIVKGAQVTTRAKLFANIGRDTSVFTY